MIGQNAFKNIKINAPYLSANGSPRYEFGRLKDEIEYQCPVERKYWIHERIVNKLEMIEL